jgi:REP element-mobilizing transposase RayT
MQKPHFYHYATEGLKDDILFLSTADFVAGINRIALILCRLGLAHPVQVICFCLMDNHLHIILYGLEDDCDLFMARYKQATELWLRFHGGDNLPGKVWNIGHWLIPDSERLKETIAYIHRNPLAAGMAVTPAGYLWSSASLLFSDHTWIKKTAIPIGNLSTYERRNLFSSKSELPGDWLYLSDGLIWPGNFVNYKLMERQFKSVRDYQFYMNKGVESDINQQIYGDAASLPDGEIAMLARSISKEYSGTDRIADLGVRERISLARKIKKQTGATSKQIARIVRLKLSELEPILNSQKG